MQYFLCVCGYQENLNLQSLVIDHMSSCNKFANISPLSKLVNNYPLKKLNVEQLLTFRHDLTLQLNKVDKALSEQGHQMNVEGSLQDYFIFQNLSTPQAKNIYDGLKKESSELFPSYVKQEDQRRLTQQQNGGVQPESLKSQQQRNIFIEEEIPKNSLKKTMVQEDPQNVKNNFGRQEEYQPMSKEKVVQQQIEEEVQYQQESDILLKLVQQPSSKQKISNNFQFLEKPVKANIQENNNVQYFEQTLQVENNLYSLSQEQRQNFIICEMCKKRFSQEDINKIWYLLIHKLILLRYVELCLHGFCKPCLVHFIQNKYLFQDGNLSCPEISCQFKLTQYDIESIVGKKVFADYQEKLLRKNNNVVCCVKCQSSYVFENGNIKDMVMDNQGKQIKGEQHQAYVNNRFICKKDNCKTEQCRNCNETPYHIAQTCEEYSKLKLSIKCRFCQAPIKELDAKKPEAIQSVCKNEDCIAREQNQCLKKLQCGHFCQGTRDEAKCLPCLNQKCYLKNNNLNQNEDDYCNFCFIEALSAAPCLQADCGHIFHAQCVEKRLEVRWNGPRINLEFCNCPLCKKWMNFPKSNKKVNDVLGKSKLLLNEIEDQCLLRLEMEGKNQDKEIKDPKSQFYQKPILYGLHIFCFYECFKCKKPYFGGLKNCQANLEDDRRDFKKEDLTCPECNPISFENKCKKHGAKFIEYKCRFCCAGAVWFCGGTVHYCDPCHSRNITKMNQPCKGPEYCPLKVAHKPNGEECALGCAVCRYEKK